MSWLLDLICKQPERQKEPSMCEAKKDCALSEQDKIDLARLKDEREAKAAEREALEKAPELAAKAKEEHERQTKGFVFECHRFGQFLTISVRRNGNSEKSIYGIKADKEFSTAINLQRVTNIRFIDGHAPDFAGVLKYRKFNSYNHDLKKHEIRISPQYPYVPQTRELVVSYAPKKHGDDNGMYTSCVDRDMDIFYSTPNYPRAAKDDEIIFDGAYFTLFAPAGLGRGVYEKILKAKER